MLKDVTIVVDKKYAQSYGGKTTENYAYGIDNGKYLILFDSFGNKAVTKDITAKHFHSFTSKKTITAEQFEKEIKAKMTKFKKEKVELQKKAVIDASRYEKELVKVISIAKGNIKTIESTKSNYNKFSTRWIKEVAFKNASKLGTTPTLLKDALYRIYKK